MNGIDSGSRQMEISRLWRRSGLSWCALLLACTAIGLSALPHPAEAARKCPDGTTAGSANECPDYIPNNAKYLGYGVPAQMVVGQRYAVSATYKNIGQATWGSGFGHKLAAVGASPWGVDRVEMPTPAVSIGGEISFNFDVVAPTTPGTYQFNWAMIQEGVGTFGQHINYPVTVVPSVIKGNIEGVSAGEIKGWACSTLLNQSIEVHFWIGGAAGSSTGAGVVAAMANLPSDGNIASACSASGSNYRFAIPFDENFIRNHGGQPVYIHGISPVGSANSVISGSGSFTIPQAVNSASFVSHSIPDQVATGRAVTGIARFTNTGNITWRRGAGYQLITYGGALRGGAVYTDLPSDVPPGGSVDIPVSFRAPLAAGAQIVRWRMRDGGGEFGAEGSKSLQVTMPTPVEHGIGSVARQYVYDANQQLCKVIEPETGSTVMAYDAAGNLAWSASGVDLPSTTSCDLDAAAASGRQVTRSYDVRNRLKTLRFPDRNGDQDWDHTSDGLPSRVTTANDGGTKSVINTYAYNKRRLLVHESVEQPSSYAWGMGYGYDAYGKLSSNTYPTGLSVSYSPNALGQPTRVSDQAGGVYASAISYHPNGAINQFTYGNGVQHTLALNARQMPLQVRDLNVSSYEYRYDPNGNVSTIYDQQQGESFNRYLEYDGLDRLTDSGSASFGGDHWHRYAYDVLDNILSSKLGGVKENNHWYDTRNRLTNIRNDAGATTIGLAYDVQGNLTSKNGQRYTFDYGNRLREAQGIETYRYDALGRRVASVDGSGNRLTSMYGRDGQMFYEERAGKGPREHIYLQGSVLAIRSNGSEVTYQHTDALGSPVAVTNAASQVVERTQHEPYGAAIGKTVDGIGYTGHIMDGATGLTYMQQRYYDPGIGQFLSVDPVTADTTTGWNFNRYNYAANNPYKFKDPDGRIIETGWDVANVVMDVASLGKNLATGNYAGAALDAGGLVVDAAATVVPGVPGGAGAGIKAYRVAGAAREAVVAKRLAAANPGASVQAQRALRTADGKRALDPVTGKGRVVDHAVIKDGKVSTYETTSLGADKTAQLAKEQRILDNGGTFIRDRETRELVPVNGRSEVIREK